MAETGEWVFIGEYQHVLDDKNRLFIPAKFREPVAGKKKGGGFYITRGMDQCLFLFTPEGWEEVSETFRQGMFTRPDHRNFQRIFFGKSSYSDLDKQGRILIPETLKGLAGLSKDVMLIGVDRRIEVWDAERWKTFDTQTGPEFDKLAEKLF